MNSWFDFAKLSEVRDIGYGPGPGPNAVAVFTDTMFGRGTPVFTYTLHGPLADGKSTDGLPEQIEGIRLLACHFENNSDKYQVFVWDEGVLTIHERNELHVCSATTDQSAHDRLVSKTKGLFGPRRTAHVHVLGSSDDGVCLRTIGKGGRPLERGNYTDRELACFDHIVTELEAPNPCGRLTILSGPPGTGKTYFIEGLIVAQPKVKYVLVPPDMVSGLTSPGLVGALQQGEAPIEEGEAESGFRQPIVLIVEDADDCLVSRMQDNLPALSTLLNLAAGILGRWLDVRVIATSNATTNKIDPALKRPGRLCRMVQFAPLEPDHARAVGNRLGTSVTIEGQRTLAEIYALTRQTL